MEDQGRYGAKLTYPPESFEKKLTRLLYWLDVRSHMGVKGFLKGKYLGLASEEAGDASVLLGLGVPGDSIVLADLFRPAVEAARKKFPQVSIYRENVIYTPYRYPPGHFHAAYLDLCGNASHANLTIGQAVVEQALCYGGSFAFSVHIGREQDFNEKILPLTKKYRDRTAFHARATYLTQEFQRRLRLKPYLLAHYVTTNTNHRFPMCLYAAKVGGTQPEVPNYWWINEMGVHKTLLTKVFDLEQGEGLDPALLLNVPRSSIPAFRANLTRGTYDKEKTR